jgi:hypothetical protein
MHLFSYCLLFFIAFSYGWVTAVFHREMDDHSAGLSWLGYFVFWLASPIWMLIFLYGVVEGRFFSSTKNKEGSGK